MIRHKQKLSGVRIGPVSILVFVIALSIAVLATLAITTARANEASTERQIAFTTDTYANEVAGQTMLSLVDASLANGISGVQANLDAIQQETQKALSSGTVTISLSENILDANFETESGRQLIVKLELSNSSYKIVKWKTATDWTEEETEHLWTGEE